MKIIKLPLTIPAQVKAPSKALLKNFRRAIIPNLIVQSIHATFQLKILIAFLLKNTVIILFLK